MNEPSVESITRITVRPLGSPLPLGFLAFGTGVLLLTAFDAHWIPPGEQRLVATLALGFVMPLELRGDFRTSRARHCRFRKGAAKTAIEGSLHDQLRDVSREPGVRLQL